MEILPPRRSVRGLQAPRVARLDGLGAAPWEAPLRPDELPRDLLYIHPRYVVKVVNDLLDDKATLAQCEAWAADPPDWVKQKNKLGQDSYRLACFIRHRLNHRIPKNWFDTQLDSDASLIIEGRWKYNDISMETLAAWSTQAPNWKPWNRDKDLTAVIMPAVLWARKVASARAGIDIPFFVDSTVEDLTDRLVAEQEKSLLSILEVICNVAATLGIGAATSATAAAEKAGTAAVKAGGEAAAQEGGKTFAQKATEYGVGVAKAQGKAEVQKAEKRVVQAVASTADTATGKSAIMAVGTGAASAATTALFAATPVGWVALAALAAAPVLCWGLKSYALKLIKDNLRDWVPDFVPKFIASVYAARFGVAPTPEQVVELDQRYSWAISANTIAKLVASPENNPLIIDAVTQRQSILRAAVNDAVGKLVNCVPNPVVVANVANTAFNALWDGAKIANYVSANRAAICKQTVSPGVLARTAGVRSALAVQAVANITGIKPVATANVKPSDMRAIIIPKTIAQPPAAPAKGGVGAALALAVPGFFVGGPVGAGIGFVVGLAAGGKKA